MLLQASDIHVSFPEASPFFLRRRRRPVLKGVSLFLREGQCLGIVGESGCGKSTLGRVLIGLLRTERGRVLVCGEDLYDRRGTKARRCGSVVFQDYTSSVNPRFRIEAVMNEPLRTLEGLDKRELRERAAELLERVGLGGGFLERYPHQLSGGQLQRVCIARALAGAPRFLLLDEAVSSLDVSVQVQIMDLLAELKETHGLSYLFITHDLEAVTYLCDSVLFMHDGVFVEETGDVSRIGDVTHPFARQLLSAVAGFDMA